MLEGVFYSLRNNGETTCSGTRLLWKKGSHWVNGQYTDNNSPLTGPLEDKCGGFNRVDRVVNKRNYSQYE